MKPELHWSCVGLAGGWTMFGVDAYRSAPDQPECLLGYRCAIHPGEIVASNNTGITFASVTAEMNETIERGIGLTTQPLCASRARAFAPADLQPAFEVVQTDSSLVPGGDA